LDQTTDTEMTDVDVETPNHNSTPSSNAIPSNGYSTGASNRQSNSVSVNAPSASSGSSGSTGSSGSPDSQNPPLELEAVVSCTSDGLVVCLRRARPAVPTPFLQRAKPAFPSASTYMPNPYFAAPWGSQAIYTPAPPPHWGSTPQWPGIPVAYGGPPVMQTATIGQPSRDSDAFMAAIQECGVFAWDLVGINGSLADYAHGNPTGRAAPSEGPAIWDPEVIDADADAALHDVEKHSTSSGRGTAESE